jgi:hypothetical protein
MGDNPRILHFGNELRLRAWQCFPPMNALAKFQTRWRQIFETLTTMVVISASKSRQRHDKTRQDEVVLNIPEQTAEIDDCQPHELDFFAVRSHFLGGSRHARRIGPA